MTTERQERRTAGVNRVQVARIVDICGRDRTVPAFEAQSVELSGRGMQVRTPYLPPLGAPLVCRLEDGGREIVVEGVVAWQRDRDGGGEFGVQFTALDSGSVEALKSLCGLEPRVEAPAPTAKSEAAPPGATTAIAPSGTPVKLHIDGLGAPMKARVKTGSVRKLQVGSNLEFLKVGRGLEVEDVEQGERRGARIDSVSIAIDPETQVPQLVVMLRYAGEDTTPEPSVVDDEDEDESNAGSVAELRAALTSKPSEASAPASIDDADDTSDEDDDAAAAMRGRMDAFAVNVGRAAKNTSDKLAVAGGAAAAGLARFLKDKGGRLGEMAAKRAKGTPKKRSTAPAPATTTSSGQQRLRPQNGGDAEGALGDPKRRKVLIGAGVGVALTLAVCAMALSGRSNKTRAASDNSTTAVAAGTPDSLAATPGSLPALGATPPAMAATPATPGAPGSPVAANAPGLPGQRPGVVANVPLFGPTPMATLEPAPLGPAPDQIAPLTATAAAQQPATEERMEDDEKASNDESFGGGSSKDNDKKDRSPEALAEAVKPFVQGKLHLPLLHRLKLDKPGTAIQGKKDVAGFTVIIPGRKVEGGGASIAKRDDRISEVRTKNGPGGAQISFIFRSKIPGYKVRLKKSSVEFFISSPDSAK
jgi:hypothetical protein